MAIQETSGDVRSCTASNGSNGSSNGSAASNGSHGLDHGLDHGRSRDASTGRKLIECALIGSLPMYVTLVVQADAPSCRVSRLIALTTGIYGILYGILRQCKGLLQPARSSWSVQARLQAQASKTKTTTKTKSETQHREDETPRLSSEWRSRLLAMVNAVVLSYGSLLCFNEWSGYVPASEGWVKTTDSNVDCFGSHPVTFASLFVGYLQWDLCWLVWHRKTHPDPGSMIHHCIFIAVTHFVLWGTYFRRPFAWLSLTEVSTPFLHLRWFLAATGRKEKSKLYVYISVGFALSFLSTRAVGYGLGLVDLWLSRASWSPIAGLWGVVFGLHLAYGLNLFWSVRVGSALARALSSSSSGNNKEKRIKPSEPKPKPKPKPKEQ